jgi:hypothetical protein
MSSSARPEKALSARTLGSVGWPEQPAVRRRRIAKKFLIVIKI